MRVIKNGSSQIPNFAREAREFLIWWRHQKKSRAIPNFDDVITKNSENGDVIAKNSENADVMAKNSENGDVIARKWSFWSSGAEGAGNVFRAKS